MQILCPNCESVFDSIDDKSAPSTRCPNCGSTVSVVEQYVATGKVTIPIPKHFPTAKEVSVVIVPRSGK